MTQEVEQKQMDTVDASSADPYIRLASGDRWHYINLKANIGVPLDVLLWGLSNISRFTGQGGRDYDVLRHSYVVYQVLERELPQETDLLVGALFHDLPEAVMGDVASPLKKLLKDYNELYRIHENFIINQYKLPPFDSMDRIKGVDKFVGDVEGEYFIPGWKGLTPSNKDMEMIRAWIRQRIAESIKMTSEELINFFMEKYNNWIAAQSK